jgi:hypothetical protein
LRLIRHAARSRLIPSRVAPPEIFIGLPTRAVGAKRPVISPSGSIIRHVREAVSRVLHVKMLTREGQSGNTDCRSLPSRRRGALRMPQRGRSLFR